jgi:hypothetical protein
VLSRPEPACLLIADISGYTSYLAGAELDHAQDILADLMTTVVAALRPGLRLAKLEGDAAFVYVLTERIDGSQLLDTVERTYFAFRRRLRDIARATACQCNACVLMPRLDLKVIAHHGSIIRHRIAGAPHGGAPSRRDAGRSVGHVHHDLRAGRRVRDVTAAARLGRPRGSVPADRSAARTPRSGDAERPRSTGVSAATDIDGRHSLARLAARNYLALEIKAPPKGTTGFTPLAPLDKVEHAFARLGRWRRLSGCHEGTEASARAWLEAVCVAYVFVRLRAEPT